MATVAPASSAAKSSIAALPSDFFDDASSNRPVAGSSKPAAASAPTASSVPRAAATAALPPSSLASAPLVAGKAGADSASAVPAGFFDDPLTEMQVRQIKIEKPDFRYGL